MVDGVGSDYALSGGHNALTGAGRVPAVEQLWMSAFRSAQYLWLTASSAPRIPWTPRLRAYFRNRPMWRLTRRNDVGVLEALR